MGPNSGFLRDHQSSKYPQNEKAYTSLRLGHCVCAFSIPISPPLLGLDYVLKGFVFITRDITSV